MRVLMLAQFYDPVIGGEERVVQQLSVELAGRGHEVAVATLRLPGTPRVDETDGVRLHRLDALVNRLDRVFEDTERRHLPPFPDPILTRELRRVVEEERPDVVHAHNWIAYSYAPLSRRVGAPFVLSLHDYSLVCANKRLVRRGTVCAGPGLLRCLRCSAGHYGAPKGAAVSLSLSALSPWLRRRVDAFVPVSRAVADAVGLTGGRHRYELIPNLVSIAEEVPGEDLSVPLPSGDFILFVGDARTDKGVQVLLKAHSMLASSVPLVLVGRHSDLAGVELPAGVSLLGPQAHRVVLEAIRRCSVLVLPSLTPETFGMAVLEAMALGRPVVASAVGGLPELVSDGATGRLVQPGDARQLRNALSDLLADPGARERLGLAAAARAAAYTPTEIVPRFERLYENLVSRRARRTHVDC